MIKNRLNKLRELFSSQKNDPFIKYALALEFWKLNDQTEVVKLFGDLLANHSDYLPTYYQAGKFYEEVGKFDHAENVYKEGIDVARKQGDQKTLHELMEALEMLED